MNLKIVFAISFFLNIYSVYSVKNPNSFALKKAIISKNKKILAKRNFATDIISDILTNKCELDCVGSN